MFASDGSSSRHFYRRRVRGGDGNTKEAPSSVTVASNKPAWYAACRRFHASHVRSAGLTARTSVFRKIHLSRSCISSSQPVLFPQPVWQSSTDMLPLIIGKEERKINMTFKLSVCVWSKALSYQYDRQQIEGVALIIGCKIRFAFLVCGADAIFYNLLHPLCHHGALRSPRSHPSALHRLSSLC